MNQGQIMPGARRGPWKEIYKIFRVTSYSSIHKIN